MIEFKNILNDLPYLKFKKLYDLALKSRQTHIEAVAISSYALKNNDVDSRFVNLKYIIEDKWIFFSNYNSPKAIQFNSHDQISALFFWPTINIQIRMKAKIKKTPNEFNQKYFFKRSKEKNALAISSNQSNTIKSYTQVEENYKKSLKNDNLKKCPEYWGGFSFTPYYFEFWEGHESRINKREIFKKINGLWKQSYLQP